MNDDLKQKLLKDLEKTGFGSEMRAIGVFVERKWIMASTSTYFDLDEEKSRAIDVHSTYGCLRSLPFGISLECRYDIVAEVKKSEHPWVVFRTRQYENWELKDARLNLIDHRNIQKELLTRIETVVSEKSLLAKLGWKASGVHEAFKKPEDSTRWYSASVSTCKAAAHIHKGISAEMNVKSLKGKPNNDIHFCLTKPIVILDGMLVSTQIDESGEIVLEEISAASLEMAYRSPKYRGHVYIVDLVCLSWLDQYLQLSEERVQAIADVIRDRTHLR